MRHELTKPEWLDELNKHLVTLGRVLRELTFKDDFVLLEEDYLLGREPEDVAVRIHSGAHMHIMSNELFAY